VRDTQLEHDAYQRSMYARDPARPAIAPADTPYVGRHLTETLRSLDVPEGTRLLEVGAGVGRFTGPLLEAGYPVFATDLSPVLLESLRTRWAGRLAGTVVSGIEALPEKVQERFPAAVGFFMLHHLLDVGTALRSLAAVLEPGARVAFCEPNGLNPLFYLQILLSPGMTWRGDGGIRHMTPGKVLRALERCGFVDLKSHRYGLFPPALTNLPGGVALEGGLERLPLPPVTWAWQVFSGRLGDR
jgi:SAM-dependent methyltransferase